MSDTPNSESEHLPEDDPRKILPFFKSWRGLYAFVLGELFVLIILFYLFSKAFE